LCQQAFAAAPFPSKFSWAGFGVCKPIYRHNLLNRQIKPTAKKLGLPKEIGFRSFRTMHSSLMLRQEPSRESRATIWHANIEVIQNVYERSWWEEERVDAVTRTIGTIPHAIGVP
jgi:hypothetical protein